MAAILKVGIPSTLVQAVSSVLAIYVNSVLMVITPTAVAVYGACVKIQGLVTVGGKRHGKRADPYRSLQLRRKKAKENLPELQMGDALFCDILQYIFPDNGGFSGMGAVIV